MSDILQRFPGIKEPELRQLSTCAKCRQKIGHAGPIFYRVRLEQICIDAQAATRQHGLALAMGNAKLAMLMGPDEDLAKIVLHHEAVVCNACAGEFVALEAIELGREVGG